MEPGHRQIVESVAAEYATGRYQSAADAAAALLHAAAASSPRELLDVARALVDGPAFVPVFARVDEAQRAAVFFGRVMDALKELLAAGDPVVAQWGQHLATIRTLQDQSEGASALLEASLIDTTRAFGPYHEKTLLVRRNLAIQCRNMGQDKRAEALFADVKVCEHLQPVLDYVRSQGVAVWEAARLGAGAGGLWVAFNRVILDAEALRARLELPDCVVVHSHHGKFEGSEYGLVCRRDHDALIGVHPDPVGRNRHWWSRLRRRLFGLRREPAGEMRVIR